MRVVGLSLPLVKPGDDLTAMIPEAAKQVGGLRGGDVVVVSSKVVATSQGRLRELSKIRPSPRARRMAKKSGLAPEFVEVVLREAGEVLGVSRKAILTIKSGHICANAGADLSNVMAGHAVLMPAKPDRVAEEIRGALAEKTGVKIGVIITDSNVRPLRLGTVGQAIGVAGMEPVVDCRGQLDLYGKPLRITFRAVADQLATAAQVVMGEAGERVPVAVMRGAGVELVEKPKRSHKISPKRCIYFGRLARAFWGSIFIVGVLLFIVSSFYFAHRLFWHSTPWVVGGGFSGETVAENVENQLRGIGIMPPILLDNRGVDFERYIAEIKAWGANTIRVPIYPVIYYSWENVLPWDDIDRAVTEAEKNGLMVVLDFHAVGYPPEETFHTEPTGEQTENIFYYRNDWLCDFWENASARYRGENTIIAYEIFNEVKWSENDNDEVCWLRWKAFAEENIISRIRANDPDKLILVSGIDYARDLSWSVKYPIEDNNVAYKRTSYWEWAPKLENVPTIFAETDECALRFLEGQGVSWIVYCFSVEWAPNLLLDYDNFTPSLYGQTVKAYLQGAPPVVTWVEIMLAMFLLSLLLMAVGANRLIAATEWGRRLFDPWRL